MKVTHLILDCISKSNKKLKDRKAIRIALEKIAFIIEMKTLVDPVVVKGRTLPGVSGFVIIEESHISIHTFTDKNYLNIDVFSCKPFDPDKVIEFIKEYFELEKIWISSVARELEGLQTFVSDVNSPYNCK